MKMIINNNNFGDIGTAVFYRWYKYIPNNLDNPSLQIPNYTSDKIQFRASRTYLNGYSFNEYNFKYDIEKYKFNDLFKINNLSSKSKNIVGMKVDDLEKLEKVIFPTLIEESISDNIEFFGSTLISNQTFLLFNIPGQTLSKGYWKVELYEDNITTNSTLYPDRFIDWDLLKQITNNENEIVSPAITITFGPESDILNNPSDMYFPNDPILGNRVAIDLKKYRGLMEEIINEKVLWTLISSDSSIKEINLSYKSWSDSTNPNRNDKDWIIRNDELYATLNSFKIIEQDNISNFWIDTTSGNLVGNIDMSSEACPILQRKLKKGEKDLRYSPYIRYNLGDEVTYGDNKWISLRNNNYNNCPSTSTTWSICDVDELNTYTSRVFISINPLNSGLSDPNGNITIINDEIKRFNVIEKLGYEISKTNACTDGEGNSVPYSLDISQTAEEKINTITILDWLLPKKSGKLVFNFDKLDSEIEFVTLENSIIKEYNDWVDFYLEPEFKLKNVKVNSENVTDVVIPMYITPGDYSTIEVTLPELSKYTISKITLEYTIDNIIRTRDMELVTTGYADISFIDKVDYNKGVYILNLINKILSIQTEAFFKFEVSEVIGKINYGESYSLRFYPLDDAVFTRLNIFDLKTGDLLKYIQPNDLGGKNIKLGEGLTTLDFEKDLENIYSLNINHAELSYKIEIL